MASDAPGGKGRRGKGGRKARGKRSAKRVGGIDLSKLAPGDRAAQGPAETAPAAEVARAGTASRDRPPAADALDAAVEAVVFAADDPVTPAQVAKAVGAKAGAVRKAIQGIRDRLERSASGLALEEIAGGWQFLTREEHAEAIRRLRKSTEERKLSAAALETLAVVAYKQPVQRQEIEDVRGVGSGPMLRGLMEKGLVKIVGRAEVLGRPLLYGTTKKFLQGFGLASLRDLPKVAELTSDGGSPAVGETSAAGETGPAGGSEGPEGTEADGSVRVQGDEAAASGVGATAGGPDDATDEAQGAGDS